MARTDAPMQAFAALKAAKPPATPRGRERQAILIDHANNAQTRYAHVGAHEWARRRLCSILQLPRYDQWNGYLPPRLQPEPDRAGEKVKPNNAPGRVLLVELLQDVHRFEQSGELPDYAIEGEVG